MTEHIYGEPPNVGPGYGSELSRVGELSPGEVPQIQRPGPDGWVDTGPWLAAIAPDATQAATHATTGEHALAPVTRVPSTRLVPAVRDPFPMDDVYLPRHARRGTGNRRRPVVSVDNNRCHLYAICQMEAPASFELGEDDRLRYDNAPPMYEMDRVRQAARFCPMQAITLEGDE